MRRSARTRRAIARYGLTELEVRTLELMAEGCTYGDAASWEGVSVETIKTRLKVARAKLEAENTTHAVSVALRERVLT